jgi:SAM-dependent methyltransferase
MSRDEKDENLIDADKYIHGMDWLGVDELKDFELSNYRKYQFDLIGKHIGKNILEVGSGDRSFTNQIVKNTENIERIVSIEPSPVMMELYKEKYKLPDFVKFLMADLFDMNPASHGLFDTIILVHVLEHIEKDRQALSHLHSLLAPKGKVLIEVPAMKFLFSVHDKMLGHYRRYNKRDFKAMVDNNLYNISDLWFQDEIGMVGSLIYFKLMGVKLKSEEGIVLVKNQGGFYDRYVIPFEIFYERLLRFPFGLSLTGILEKK